MKQLLFRMRFAGTFNVNAEEQKLTEKRLEITPRG